MKVLHYITEAEAAALRAHAVGFSSGTLNAYFPKPQYRVGLGCPDGTPFKIVVKIGKEPSYDQADVERYKLGLWSRAYFRFRPRCRLCGEQISDGSKALAFVLNPSGEDEWPHWRKAIIHAEDCSV